MKLAIITGGSRGLGRALCELYARRGWQVIEFSRSAPHAYSVSVDLGDSVRAANVFERTFASIDSTDLTEIVVVSNAGVLGPVGPVQNAVVDEIMAHLQVNIASAVLLWRAVAGAFQDLACPKTFASISSGAATKGYAGWSLYCASKAALENYLRAVALEQHARRYPIRAFSIGPGVMDTAMQKQVRESAIEDFPSLERFTRLHAEGKLLDPAVVASRIAAVVESRPEPGGVYQAG